MFAERAGDGCPSDAWDHSYQDLLIGSRIGPALLNLWSSYTDRQNAEFKVIIKEVCYSDTDDDVTSGGVAERCRMNINEPGTR